MIYSTPVGFAALVHTRCAFIASGISSNIKRLGLRLCRDRNLASPTNYVNHCLTDVAASTSVNIAYPAGKLGKQRGWGANVAGQSGLRYPINL